MYSYMRVALLLVQLIIAGGAIQSCMDVTNFGAKGDGHSDDTAAFQAAVDAAAPTAGCVYVPSAARGSGFVLTGTITLAPGVRLIGEAAGTPAVPHCYGAPGDFNTTGGARILARMAASRAALFHITQGCAVAGLLILYDRMPFPTDAEFTNPGSRFYYPNFEV